MTEVSTYTDKHGTLFVYKGHMLHNDYGPAIVEKDGSQCWLINDQYHRLDGPAIEDADGMKMWYITDNRYSSNKEYQEAAGLSDEDMAILVLKYGNVA